MKPKSIYYEHSGKLTKRGIMLAVIGGLLAAPLIGALGSTMMLVGFYFIDVGFIGVLFTGGFAGMLMAKVIKLGKIRNERFALWGGLFIGFLGLLVTCFFTYVFLQIGDVEAATGLPNGVYYPWEDPERMFTIVHGYVMDDTKVASAVLPGLIVALLTKFFFFAFEFPHLSGVWLYGLWILEALILVLWAGLVSKTSAGKADYVYCEACEQEAQVLFKSPLLNALPLTSFPQEQKLQSDLGNGLYETLEALPVAKYEIQPDDYSQLILRGCDHCQELYCADLVKVVVKWDGYNLEQTENEGNRIIEHLMLPPSWYARLRDHFENSEHPDQPVDTDTPAEGGKLILILVGVTMLAALGIAVLFP